MGRSYKEVLHEHAVVPLDRLLGRGQPQRRERVAQRQSVRGRTVALLILGSAILALRSKAALLRHRLGQTARLAPLTATPGLAENKT